VRVAADDRPVFFDDGYTLVLEDGSLPRMPLTAAQSFDAGAVPLLVLGVQEPELSLKRLAASALLITPLAVGAPPAPARVVPAAPSVYVFTVPTPAPAGSEASRWRS
jgi:hypothetical protein